VSVLVLPAGAWGSPEAVRLNEAGIALARDGRYDDAAAVLARALALAPGDAVIRQNLARVRTALGHRHLARRQFGRAAEEYRAALDLAPDEVPALLGLGEAQLATRDPGAAAMSFRRAAGLDPRSADAHRGLGEACYNQGDLEGALTEWGRALALAPNDAALRERIQRVEREARVQGGYRARGSHHFTALYEGERQEAVGGRLVEILERAYADVGYILGGYPGQDVQVIFYADQDFSTATGVSPAAGGFYHLLDGKIRIAMRGLQLDDPVLGSIMYHEYAHALVYFLTRGNNPPRWMHEGLAVHVERQRAPEFRAEAVRQARAGRLPDLDASPYVHGSVAVETLIEQHGLTAIQALLGRLAQGQRFPQAFQETFRTDLATFQRELREALSRRS
jgi:tetratricopeptide (TPR) repeat protein